LMLGFLLGTLATSSTAVAPGIRSGTMGMMVIPLLPFGIALLDVFLAILRRSISGQDIFIADSDHIHHRLLEKFGRPRQVVTLLYGFSALLCAMTLLLVLGPKSALMYGCIFLAGLIVLALTAMILKIYMKESLYQLIENRTHFQFLSSYRNFMSQRVGRARSFGELCSLAESGVKDLGYDSVEIMENNHPLHNWTNQVRVHPEAPRYVMEKSLNGTNLIIRWIAPTHYSESYQKYLQTTWDQFLTQLESGLQNLADYSTPRPRNLFSNDSNIISTMPSLNTKAFQDLPVPFYVITVNYYGKRYLLELIKSLRSIIFLEKMIIVNHSSYEDLDDLQADFDIHIINQINKGYGAGLNRGLREVVEDDAVALLCNPDISLLNPQAIPEALSYMTDHPQVACLIPQLVNYELKPNHACRQFYTLKTLLAARIPWVYNRSLQFMRNHLYLDYDRNDPFEVDWGCGGAMLVKTSLFPSPLCFDERFFLYLEDVDLCAQAYQNDLSVVFFPKLLFCHYEMKSSHKKVLFLIQHLWSLGKFIWKYRGLPQRETLRHSRLNWRAPRSTSVVS
jgi:GT2 family glycosyltransferase